MNNFASATPFSSKPRKILYPLPSNECATETVTCAHIESTAWVVLTPLEMVQKIALMAVNSPAFLANNDSRFQCGRALIETFVTDSLNQGNDAHAGQKRKRDCTDDSLEFDDDVDSLATVLESVDIQPSDCSFNSWTPALPVGQTNSSRLDLLVRDFERIVVSTNITWCLPSYNRVQQLFLSDIARAGSDAEARLNVVIRASRQLQALVDSVLPTKNSDLSSKSFDTVTKTKRQSLNFHMMSWVSCNWKNPFPDDEVLNYLTNFLIENQSVSLSSKDITRLNGGEPLVSITSEKIDNWLVNARTRKWRPSIEQAFNLRRPASLLLEDSLRIFEGKDLRPLVGWDDTALFSFNQKYLTPIKTWKRTKGANRLKKSEVTKLLGGSAGRVPTPIKQEEDEWVAGVVGLLPV